MSCRRRNSVKERIETFENDRMGGRNAYREKQKRSGTQTHKLTNVKEMGTNKFVYTLI